MSLQRDDSDTHLDCSLTAFLSHSLKSQHAWLQPSHLNRLTTDFLKSLIPFPPLSKKKAATEKRKLKNKLIEILQTPLVQDYEIHQILTVEKYISFAMEI